MPIPFRRLLWPKSLAGKAGVIGSAMAITLATVYVAALWMTSKRLAAAMEVGNEHRFSSDPQALLGPCVPDEENAATPLDESCAIAKRYLASVRQKLGIPVATPEASDDPEFYAEMDRLIGDTVFEDLLKKADQRRGYCSPTEFADNLQNTSLPHVQDRRWICRAERAISYRLQTTGRHEEAVRRLLRVLRVTRKWEDKEPFAISLLTNIAIRGQFFADLNRLLRDSPKLSSATHNDIDWELRQHDHFNRVLPLVGHWEKLSISSYIEDQTSKSILRVRPLSNHVKTVLFEDYNQAMNQWNAPFSEAIAVFNAIDKHQTALEDSPFFRLFNIQKGIGHRMCHVAVLRTMARARCLRVINAWSQQRNFNVDLSKLDLPEDALVDPFDGRLLRIKKTSNGPIIYSVSDDLVDDNGDIDHYPGDQGYGPVKRVKQ